MGGYQKMEVDFMNYKEIVRNIVCHNINTFIAKEYNIHQDANKKDIILIEMDNDLYFVFKNNIFHISGSIENTGYVYISYCKELSNK